MKQHESSKCDVCARPHFERNNYFYGKQFTVRDLFQEQSYFNDKRYLINRMVLGWGVVCGLDVQWVEERREFVVGTGMALDCCGREIIICEPQTVPFKEYDDQSRYQRKQTEYGGRFVLCLQYDDCFSEPVELPPGGCDEEDRSEFNRVRDGFKLRIKSWEDACPKEPSERVPCLNRFKHDLHTPEPRNCETQTIHHYLCGKLKEGCPECECDCVVLATIEVRTAPPGHYEPPQDYQQEGYEEYEQQQQQYQPNQYPVEINVDTCTYRRFVYNNTLLYDLIYCHHGDLPHIVDFNWRKLAGPNRELEWDAFVQLLQGGLTVYFDREMEPASLNHHTFFLTFFHEDPDSGNIFVKRIPAKEVTSGPYEDCYTAVWMPDAAWIDDELMTQKSQLRGGVDVEITLRGSRIWDSRGKGLDGAFLADQLPTGNGTQGTEFIDWFHVLPRDDKKSKAKSYTDY